MDKIGSQNRKINMDKIVVYKIKQIVQQSLKSSKFCEFRISSSAIRKKNPNYLRILFVVVDMVIKYVYNK